MAKKIKFPLILKDGVQVRTLEELQDNFDFDRIYDYFVAGKLLIWLNDRYYEDESEQIGGLTGEETDFQKRVFEIFGIPFTEEPQSNLEAKKRNREKYEKVKHYTDDEEILSNLDAIAMNQEELADLLDEDYSTIYLFEGTYKIPLSRTGVNYCGLGVVKANISSKKDIDLGSLGLMFNNVTLICKDGGQVKVPVYDNVEYEGNFINGVDNSDSKFEFYHELVAGTRNTTISRVKMGGLFMPAAMTTEGTRIALICKEIESGKMKVVDYVDNDFYMTSRFVFQQNETGYVNLLNSSVKEYDGKLYYVKQIYDGSRRTDVIACYNFEQEENIVFISSTKLQDYWKSIGRAFSDKCDIVISLDELFVSNGKMVFKAGYRYGASTDRYDTMLVIAAIDGEILDSIFLTKENLTILMGGREDVNQNNSHILFCDEKNILILVRQGRNANLLHYDFDIPELGMKVVDSDIKFNYNYGMREMSTNSYVVLAEWIYYIKSEDKAPIVYDKGPFHVMKYNINSGVSIEIETVKPQNSLTSFSLFKNNDKVYLSDSSIFNRIHKSFDMEDVIEDKCISEGNGDV